MIYQEPIRSLNPLQSIEQQMREVFFVHREMNPRVRNLPKSNSNYLMPPELREKIV
jgi:ABC-type microcin C transport system duplicated ATPase subunit YejF